MKEQDAVSSVALPSGTVTFLFSDIEGSTRRWARDRAAMQDAVRLHDQLMRAAIAAHDGYVFKTVGDAFCAAFSTPESAAQAALQAQRTLDASDFTAVDGLRVRMAVNTGTADERDGDYFGPTVNFVARLLALAHGGQIVFSNAAAELLRQNLPPQATLMDLGAHALKDLEGHEHVYQLVVPDLQSDFPELRSHKALGPWLVPDMMRTRYFTGRDDLLAKLRRRLVEQHRAALSGLGGVGKTQLAIEYAVRHRVDYPDGVFWVNAESAGGLTGGFVEIAKTLRLPAAESNNHEQAVRAVLERLNGTSGWLLILDNVANRHDVQAFVPERGGGDVLITSRESVFPELGIPRSLEVLDLAAGDTVRFLLARTGRGDADPSDRAAAAELAAELGNLPLALEQAAAYIAETNADFSSYLNAFRKRRVALLEKAVGLVARDTVAVTWAANFEAVEAASPAAADVLRIAALLAPDAIPFELFLEGAPSLGDSIAHAFADPDDLVMTEVLRPLGRYSLIRSDTTARTFSVHRLVQAVVWAAVPEEERPGFAERAVVALEAVFPEREFATVAQCERLVRHVVSIAARLDACQGQPEAAVRVLNRTGRYLRERGRYSEALALHERALAFGERALGADHPDVAHCLNNLGLVREEQGAYAEAQALHERALALRERVLGPSHPDLAHSLNNLANVHFDQGRYAEAQVLHERALAVWERALGPHDVHVADSLNNLAIVRMAQGRYAEAQALLERALAIREDAYGLNHRDLANSLDNLADTFNKLGRFAEAQTLAERALAIREAAFGLDYPEAAYSLVGLANAYVGLGRYAESELLFKRALDLRERMIGSDHPAVAESLAGLANLYTIQGRFIEAEPLFARSLDIRERGLGREHVDVAQSLVGLATLRKQQGRTAEAAALYQRALDIKKRTFAADHPELAELREAIAQLT